MRFAASELPEGVKVAEVPDGTAISFPWRTTRVLFGVLFVVVWDGVLINLAGTQEAGKIDGGLIMGLLVFGAAGAVLTYAVLAALFNSTTIVVTSTEVCVSYGPVPWWGTKYVSRDDVAQVYVRDIRGAKGMHFYSVDYATPTGRKLRLTGQGVNTLPARAEFVARTLRETWRLPDG